MSDTIFSTMKKLALFLTSVAFALLAAGCGQQGSKAEAPANFRVVAGDASVIATWDAEPGVDYWIFFGTGPNITTSNWANSGGVAITSVTSPRIITGLANGVTYSFTINGRKDRGPGGPGAPTQVAVPTVAGANWAAGAPLGTSRLNAIASGTLLTGFSTVTVGAGGVIYSNVDVGPLTARTNPAAPVDLNAVWYGFAGMVAGGANGTLLHSIDGSTWVTRTSGTTAAIYGGASSITGTYVAVGAAGAALSSTNATDWTTHTSGTDNDLYGVVYGQVRFVAVGAAGTALVSTDGNNWGAASTGTTNHLRGVAYALVPSADGVTTTATYVAVGAAGTVLISGDGLAWALQPPFTTANLNGIVYGGRFVAVGDDGVIFTSIDGIAWVSQASGTTNDLTSVTRQLSGYTAVGELGTNVSTF